MPSAKAANAPPRTPMQPPDDVNLPDVIADDGPGRARNRARARTMMRAGVFVVVAVGTGMCRGTLTRFSVKTARLTLPASLWL